MNDFEGIEMRLRANKQILFRREDACLQNLLTIIRRQKHRVLVAWVFDCMKDSITLLQQEGFQTEVDECIFLCQKWARGEIKMPQAKKAIIKIHSLSKTLDNRILVAVLHAVGQGCSCIHVETHAIGFVIYELSAILFQKGFTKGIVLVNQRIAYYEERLLFWQKHANANDQNWADFLLDDQRINKELLLWEKKTSRS